MGSAYIAVLDTGRYGFAQVPIPQLLAVEVLTLTPLIRGWGDLREVPHPIEICYLNSLFCSYRPGTERTTARPYRKQFVNSF